MSIINKDLISRIEQAENFFIKGCEILNQIKYDLSPQNTQTQTTHNTDTNNTITNPTNATTQTPQAQTAPTTNITIRCIQDLSKQFPEEVEARLSFDIKGDYIIVKPKQFLGSQMFGDVANFIRSVGGEYISAGKDSHFRVPLKQGSA